MAPAKRKTRAAAALPPAFPSPKKPRGVKDEPGAWAEVVKPEAATPSRSSSRRASVATPSSDALALVPTAPGSLSAAAPGGSLPGSPYPDMLRPTPEECWAARDALAQLHSAFFQHKEAAQEDGGNRLGPGNAFPDDRSLALPADADAPAPAALAPTPYTILHGATAPATPGSASSAPARKSVLDSLVGAILSQNTTDATSAVAFANLKRAFPTWSSVRAADPRKVEAAVKCGGLAEIKVARIRAILDTLVAERGEPPCAEYLRDAPDEEVKRQLTRFKGVGPKTVSCVLMFCLLRPDFPVDTHVWKIAMSLGWIPKSATRDQAYEHLNRRVPDGCKFDLHVLLVEHGKVYKNSAGWLKAAIRGQLLTEGGDDERERIAWIEEMEKPGGIKEEAEEHFRLKSGKSVCG